MADGPSASGLVNYLIYLVVTLVTLLGGFIQKHFSGRLSKVEDSLERQSRDFDQKFESRRLENKEDFKSLHKKVEGGHADILKELRRNREAG